MSRMRVWRRTSPSKHTDDQHSVEADAGRYVRKINLTNQGLSTTM